MTRAIPLVILLAVTPIARAEDVWWSFQPLQRPTVPQIRNPKSEIRNEIDAFVLTKLIEKGLASAPQADKRTLIRRVTFDLIGLPPTPAEIDAFLKDDSPDAYEKLVDRLLASPHYGERQARQWMDLVHFAETHGHDQDRIRPNAWRYRDYLIAAFNTDTPYARFVQEQIAADVLFPERPELTPALGFLAAGPWDESSLRDIREDSIDREIGRYIDRDDIVTTVMNTFQGLTVQCARCHDHKFDPILQLDYYRLQAVFAGVGRGDVAFETDPTVAAKRKQLQATLAAIDRKDAALNAKLDSADFRMVVAAWEERNRGAGVVWHIPEFSAIASENGSTLTKQPDGSVTATGPRPERDTYTLTARVKLQGVTAVRLELLADDALPHRGPGRQDNGNLHLSEFTLTIAPIKGGIAAKSKPVTIKSATADFDQTGWTVTHALDGNKATAWGIYPQVGKPHEAIFVLSDALGDGETELVFRLEQLHGGGHLIGRFRLSLTTTAPPIKVSTLPTAIRAILATTAEKRMPEQARDLTLHVLREQTVAEIAALPAPALAYAAAPNFQPDASHKPTATPRVVHVLKRGDIRKPGDIAEPGALSCVKGLPETFALPPNHAEGARRAALAKWITDPKNPLTWRVAANRIWQSHFGHGLVETPSDFGRMGTRPSHPELLDWLACELANGRRQPAGGADQPAGGADQPADAGRSPGSLKHLHRLIVTSTTYRQQARHDPRVAVIDADNRYLWRQNRSRLDAEQVRDAVLLISNRLDRTMGGPSDKQFAMKPGIHVTPIVEYHLFDWDRPQGHRRSVYRFNFRTLPDPLIDCLDGADASTLTPKRTESVTAPQALALLNDEFVLVHAKALAAWLEKQSPDVDRRIAMACERTWGRPPTDAERKLLAAYATKHGLPNLCRVLFNSNEFLFVD